jgi:hypothetical protein
MDARIKELVKQAGFRVFGERVVAADQGSSGLATECSRQLIELTAKECCKVINEAKTGVNQIPAEVALDMIAKNIMEYFEVK